MSITSVNVTLKFESTAGAGSTTGDTHWQSGQSNAAQAFQGAASQYAHMTAVIRLPKMDGSASMHSNPTASMAGRLPSMRVHAYGGATARVSLPAVRFSGGMTIPNIGRVTATLPLVQGSASALAGFTAQMVGALPHVSGVAYCGAKAVIRLPSMIVASHAFVGERGIGAIRLPKMTGASTGHRSSDTASAIIILPKLTTGAQGRGSVLRLPRLVVLATATTAGAAPSQTWAYNVSKNVVTQFSNYAFRAFVRWQDRYYGVGMDGGLYLLENGDVDVATPIPWSFETGLDDMDSNAIKGVSGVYVEGTIEKGATLALVTDIKQRYTYDMKTPSAGSDQRVYRVVTGKGIRSRNIGIAMASTVGGYVEVDQIAPKYVISKRNI